MLTTVSRQHLQHIRHSKAEPCAGLAAKQIAYTLTQTPLIYYRAISFLVNAYMICLTLDGFGVNYLTHLNRNCEQLIHEPNDHTTGDACKMTLVFDFMGHSAVLLSFTTLFGSAMAMGECYGSLPSHYDLGVDLDNLWKESLNVLAAMDCERPREEDTEVTISNRTARDIPDQLTQLPSDDGMRI